MPESRSHRRARSRDHRSTAVPWGLVLGVIATLGGSLLVYMVFNASLSLNEPLRNVSAEVTAWLLRLFGSPTTTDGYFLNAGDLRFVVSADCTPAGPLLLLWGAMLVYPATLRSKLTGMALGAVALISLNFVRLVSLVIIGVEWNQALDVAHLLIWQSVMILASVVIWVAWLQKTNRALPA